MSDILAIVLCFAGLVLAFIMALSVHLIDRRQRLRWMAEQDRQNRHRHTPL